MRISFLLSRRATVLSVALITAVIVLPSARAGVIVEGAKITIATTTNVTAVNIGAEHELEGRYNPYTNIGPVPSTIEKIASSGTRQPFSRAVKAIAPPGWRGYLKDDRIAEIVDMTWSGANRPWTDVLAELLQSHRLIAILNWSTKEISFDISPAYKH